VPEPYHRGGLREALIEAGVALARVGGPDAVVLREASRRVGVSHNAAYRHFSSRDELLQVIARRSRAELARLMQQQIAEVDPGDRSLEAAKRRFRATGVAYVQFATTQPGLFRTAFTRPGLLAKHSSQALPKPKSPREPALDPFELLKQQVEELVESARLGPQARLHAELVAWSAMHGLSMLLIDGEPKGLPEQQRNEVLDRLLSTVEAGLLAG
jgi:AcrR family transcriptional regulator